MNNIFHNILDQLQPQMLLKSEFFSLNVNPLYCYSSDLRDLDNNITYRL